ncbi:membrane protein [Salmonella bongori NCTC 12419]|uniref:Membrane protein n=1 Tax=Salmonella bongori (strain ATCC 43975 / DSM 13772 / NCTC 12419) TaxID=218493 RepID=A0A0K0HG05_SALBC|nr:membrane protein [Salmonella bongori NCTC 12419]
MITALVAEVGANQRLKINFMNVCIVIHSAINAIHSVLMALHAVFPLVRNAFRYGCGQRISLLFMQEDGHEKF